MGDITLGNATAANFAVISTTVYTALITPTASAVTVDVPVDAAQDLAGNGNTAATRATSTYTGTNTAAMGAPTISGTVQVGQTLTASTSAITDTNGLTNVSYAYQWIQVATDNTETDISGAMANTYTLLAGDLGKTIKVKVTFTDDANNAETLTSAATTTVAAGTDTTAPTLVSAMVPSHGGTIVLEFSETIGVIGTPAITPPSLSL